MNQTVIRLFFLLLLVLFVVAPFAGLAPLLLVVLLAAIGSAIWSVIRVLLVGEAPQQHDSNV